MRRHSCLNEPTLVSVGSGPLYFHGPPNLLPSCRSRTPVRPLKAQQGGGGDDLYWDKRRTFSLFCFLCSILKPETGVGSGWKRQREHTKKKNSSSPIFLKFRPGVLLDLKDAEIPLLLLLPSFFFCFPAIFSSQSMDGRPVYLWESSS